MCDVARDVIKERKRGEGPFNHAAVSVQEALHAQVQERSVATGYSFRARRGEGWSWTGRLYTPLNNPRNLRPFALVFAAASASVA